MKIFSIHDIPSIDRILNIVLPYHTIYCISIEYNPNHSLYYSKASLLGTLFCHRIIVKAPYNNESLGKFLSRLTIIPHSIIVSSITKYYCIYAEYNSQQLLYTTNAFHMVKLFYNIIISKIKYDKESLEKFFYALL